MSVEGQLFNSQATVEYNGVSIDNIVTSKVSAEPVYNEQQTTVKYTIYTIEIEAIVHPESFVDAENDREDTNDALELIRNRLLAPRRKFLYNDKGFGEEFNITAGDSNSQLDIKYGPKPLRLTFEPIASNKAARINWVIAVALPKTCSPETVNQFVEFWSTSSVKINKSGYQTLTRKGKVEFIGNNSDDVLGNKASELFGPFIDSLTSPTSMEGYHLEHDFNFSPDNRVLDFNLTYTEIETPNAYPLGVVEISCEHSVGSNLFSNDPLQGAAFRSWKNSMSCTIQLRPRIPQLRAWEIFSAIVSDRLNQSVTVEVENQNGQDVITRVKVPIVLSMNIKEAMFGHSMTFSLTWVTFTQSIADIFNRSGMFKPYVNPNETWNQWVADIRTNSQNRFGNYPLTNLGITNEINDNCSEGTPTNIPDTTRGEILVQVPAIFDPQCPPEESSWLNYQNKCEIQSSSNRTVHKRYKLSDLISRSPDQIPPHTPSTSLSRQFDTNSGPDDHFVQDFGNDKHMGVVRGYAVRIGRPTEPPRVTSMGGQPVIFQKDKSKINNVVLSANNKCPVHVTQWDLKFEILGFPDGSIETEIESTGGSEQFQ